MSNEMTRRTALAAIAGAAGSVVAGGALAQPAPPAPPTAPGKLKGRIKQSVSRWCYGGISLDDLCVQAKAMGLVGIDLLGPDEWPTVQNHGLIVTMAYGDLGSIGDGWNRVENHDKLVQAAEKSIPAAAKAGITNVITFSGNRRGLSDEDGVKNCALGLKRIMKLAEDNKVNIVMELLNSKRDHRDYQCDHTLWGVALAKAVGSDRFKLLYDIYHMQIMEGDMCNTIRENIQYLAHFHTGGVPGRNEIDETQEINYARVMQALIDAKFQGYVAHEFVPRREDKLASLRQAVRICDV